MVAFIFITPGKGHGREKRFLPWGSGGQGFQFGGGNGQSIDISALLQGLQGFGNKLGFGGRGNNLGFGGGGGRGGNQNRGDVDVAPPSGGGGGN